MKSSIRDLSYTKLKFLQENSVALKLLRSEHFALSGSFIFIAFKKKDRETIPELALRNELASYLDSLPKEISSEFEQPTKYYIDYWISSGLLRRKYVSGQEDSSIEISYDVSKSLDFLIGLEQQGFIGTESRLALILDTIKKIAIESDENPGARISELEKQKQDIELQINKIKSGNLTVLNETQIKEYFSLFLDELSKLPTDFRKVTENFRDITKEIKSTLIEEQKSKRILLEDAQLANDKLEHSDQGKSFNGFMDFLRSDEARVTADEQLRKIVNLPIVEEHLKVNYGYSKANILKIWSSLYSPAQRVVESKTQFGEQIRRIVSSSSEENEKGITGLISNIKNSFLKHREVGKFSDSFFAIERGVHLTLPLERPLWSQKKVENFPTDPILMASAPSTELLSKVFSKPSIDLKRLKSNIKSCLEHRTEVTLAEVVTKFPIQEGLGELMGYLKLAHLGENIDISEDELEKCLLLLDRLDTEKQEYTANIPVITFTEESTWRMI